MHFIIVIIASTYLLTDLCLSLVVVLFAPNQLFWFEKLRYSLHRLVTAHVLETHSSCQLSNSNQQTHNNINNINSVNSSSGEEKQRYLSQTYSHFPERYNLFAEDTADVGKSGVDHNGIRGACTAEISSRVARIIFRKKLTRDRYYALLSAGAGTGTASSISSGGSVVLMDPFPFGM